MDKVNNMVHGYPKPNLGTVDLGMCRFYAPIHASDRGHRLRVAGYGYCFDIAIVFT